MSLKFQNWGGRGVWVLRKYCSGLTSKFVLYFGDKLYSHTIKKYIYWFLQEDKTPLFKQVMIETVNRCNGTCSFCPANVKDEIRPYKKMSEKVINKIIEDLTELNFKGEIYLNVNNEPLIDSRIFAIAKEIKNFLPDVCVHMITNGLLLTEEKLDEALYCIDEIIVNCYSEKYAFSKKILKLVNYINENEQRFSNIKITVVRRYSKEILSTRAGSAPNKHKKGVNIKTPCIYPYTDIVIFPDGNVGLCCNDCHEVTNFGNVLEQNLGTIWNSGKMSTVREKIGKGRFNYDFCIECDVIDAGGRENIIRNFDKYER